MPRSIYQGGRWVQELREALAATKGLEIEARTEKMHEAIDNALRSLIPTALMRCGQILNGVGLKRTLNENGKEVYTERNSKITVRHMELALNFVVRIHETQNRWNQWMIQRGRKKLGPTFPGFGGMQPVLSAGENGNGHKPVVVIELGESVPDMKDVQEAEIRCARFSS